MSARRWVLLVGVALLALVGVNLRLTLAIVSPLLPEIQGEYGLSSPVAGLVTTASVLMFGLAAPVAPALVARFDPDRVLMVGLALVCVGTGVRSLSGIGVFFGGMIVLGAGIALMNVVMPVIVKRDFAGRPGLATGVYTAALNIGSAAAAAAAVPLARGVGSWRATIAMAAIPAALALALWCARPPVRSAAGQGRVRLSVLGRQPLAWQVTGYMALQSLLYYVLLAWLPTIYADNGLTPVQAGLILAVAQLAQLVACLLVPVLAAMVRDQRALAAGFAVLTAIAYLGIAVAPLAAPLLWSVVLGLGQGGALTVALMLIVLRSPDTASAAGLSAMSQGVGYLVAACGPPLVGMIHDLTGGWMPVLLALTTVCAVECGVGILAGRNRTVRPAPPTGTAPPDVGTVMNQQAGAGQ